MRSRVAEQAPWRVRPPARRARAVDGRPRHRSCPSNGDPTARAVGRHRGSRRPGTAHRIPTGGGAVTVSERGSQSNYCIREGAQSNYCIGAGVPEKLPDQINNVKLTVEQKNFCPKLYLAKNTQNKLKSLSRSA